MATDAVLFEDRLMFLRARITGLPTEARVRLGRAKVGSSYGDPAAEDEREDSRKRDWRLSTP